MGPLGRPEEDEAWGVDVEHEEGPKRRKRRRQPTPGELETELAEMEADARGLEPEPTLGGDRDVGKRC
jgi:hypothetical protein